MAQQRQVCRGKKFSADLAAGKARLLHQSDRPAGFRQQQRGRRSRGSEGMTEQSLLTFGQSPTVVVRPQTGELLIREACAHANCRIVPGNTVAADQRQQPGGSEREVRSPRLA